jgi:hypothetical protein
LRDGERDFVHAGSVSVSVKQLATLDSSWEASEARSSQAQAAA